MSDQNSELHKKPTILPASSCALVLIFGGLFRDVSTLFQSDAAVGIDGYYYTLQVESFLKSGSFYFPTSTPIVLWLLSGLGAFVKDPIIAVKVGAILFQVCLCFGIFAFLLTITRRVLPTLVGVSITAFSGVHYYLIGEFLNSLGSLVFLIWSAFALVKYRLTRRTWWLVAAILLIGGASFSHRATVGIAALILASFALSTILIKAETKRIRCGGLGLLLFFLMLPILLHLQPFFTVPAALQEETLRIPENPLRYAFLPESVMIILSVVLGLNTIFRTRRANNREGEIAFVTVLIWCLLTALNPFLNHQTGLHGVVGRLDTFIYVQAAVIVTLSLSFSNSALGVTRAFTVALFPLLVWSVLMPKPVGLQREYLEERATLIAQLKNSKVEFCENPIIIAPHGKQFVITSVLGITSRQVRPQKSSYQCTYWLIQKGSTDAGPLFSILEESEVDALLRETNDGRMSELFTFNPHLKNFY